MTWSFSDTSLEDLINAIKGFLDILILSSGYQSSGFPAIWNPENIRNAMVWGLFLEHACRGLHSSEAYKQSVSDLDEALSSLKSTCYYPQGLSELSCATLARARELILRHLLGALHLKDAQLNAVLSAAIQMDLDDLGISGNDNLETYTRQLALQLESLNLTPGNISNNRVSTAEAFHSLDKCPEGPPDSCNSSILIVELLKRQIAVSCISVAETVLDSIHRIISENKRKELFDTHLKEVHIARNDESLNRLAMVNKWRSKSLLYLMDTRTVRLVSGASLIFSAPKVHWLQIFEQLRVSGEAFDDAVPEILELLLVGFISTRWNHVIEFVASAACDHLTSSKQYLDICNLLQRSPGLCHNEECALSSKEIDILEYAMKLSSTHAHYLWNLPLILTSAAIPTWSSLFALYLNDIEKKMGGDCSTTRCCTCNQGGKEHIDCEIAERLWCLHNFHVRGPNPIFSSCDH